MKTTSVGGVRGYEGAKHLVGRKGHILVDTEGLLLSVVVHAASALALTALDPRAFRSPERRGDSTSGLADQVRRKLPDRSARTTSPAADQSLRS